MSGAHWAVIGFLALAAFSIRLLGLIAGERIRSSRHVWVLDELPGLIVVSLVAASLAGQPFQAWIAAGFALGAAILTNNVIVAMVVGVLSFAGFALLGF
ncbi:AzlD domain-containing protein [uncultured Ruegeria sp.]|uniref:AzlD domain-containing protein n=1 Tax=uncultured Ruegeria sp. TaxID=259304 RepID=UPI0026149887|nr:AzlD domain-containing protein [uncultured Ruegeria sp.]